MIFVMCFFFFFKQKTAYEMRISDWSSDVCSSDLLAKLSQATAQGALYEVDTRLRPQGAQGPLAVTCESFAKYQREAAWTWEHMALTRARVLVGSPPVREELGRIIGEVLGQERDEAVLRADLLKKIGRAPV